jgi:4-coumarate--CoA ligase
MKGPNMFKGYHNLPELNKETFTEDGFYKTGDIGYVTATGDYYITDRVKELIKYSASSSPFLALHSST